MEPPSLYGFYISKCIHIDNEIGKKVNFFYNITKHQNQNDQRYVKKKHTKSYFVTPKKGALHILRTDALYNILLLQYLTYAL